MSITTIKVLQKQNNQLKDQLAAKAKEVKIETSLEKVRAIALRMKEPADMLKICKSISLQLQKLGVNEIRNVQTAIFYPDRGTYMNYEFYARHDKTIITETLYTNHRIAKAFARKMMEGRGNFYITNIKGAKVKDWLAYQKTTNVFIDRFLKTASSLNYYWYSLGPVALGISTYAQLTEDDQDLFKRFLKVFELAYRRYLDIEKAQAQAREAQIQVALEKVRAKTMAMHASHDIGETVDAMFREMNALGLGAIRCGISIIQPDCKMEVWTANPDVKGKVNLSIGTFDISIHPEFIKIYEAWKQKKRVHTYELKGKHLTSYFKALNDAPDYPTRYDLSRLPKLQITNCFFFREGTLFVFTTTPLGEASSKIIERFSALFGQTYQRFLDLQRAEAQARDAEIELALERVRARTMAMQRSEELQEVVHTVLERLKDLNVEFYTAIIILFKEDSKDITWWLENKEKQQYARVLVPYADIAYLRDLFDTRKNGRDHFSKIYSFDEKNELFHHLFTAIDFKYVPEKQRKFLLESEAATMSVALAKNTGIHLTRYTNKAFSEADNEILKRFAKVLEQAYTRFLDLQKAEAQARESQIQLALERVRARTMAMQKSEELSEAVFVLFQQFKELGENPDQATIGVINEKENVIEYWVTMYGNQMNKVFKFSIDEPHVTNKIYHAWKKAKKSLVIDLSGKELLEFMTYRAGKGGAAVNPKEKRRIFNVAFFSKGLLIVQSNEERSGGSIQLLERFASVFEQTYTRFLDLQKAEEQAREAQIEAALERVRSRSIGMQKSDELRDVIQVIYEQLLQLNFEISNAGFLVDYRESDEGKIWMTDATTEFPTQQRLPSFDHPFNDDYFEQKDNGRELFTKVYPFEEKNAWWQVILKHLPAVTAETRKALLSSPALALSRVLMKHIGLYLLNYNGTPYTTAENKILIRFGKVFQQTYTRFLDLKKAEVQAREAEIELGLERVRSRAMAMQTSEELSALIGTVFTVLTKLDLVLTRCVIIIYEGNEKGFRWWMANSEAPSMPMSFFVKYADMPFFNEYLKGWQERSLKWQYILEGENKIITDDFLFTQTELSLLPQFVISGMRAPDRVYLNASFNNFGNLTLASLEPLSGEHFDILLRFAKVFDLTYTRFNDLKKAEAQAREATIEAALEKVRGKAMAMHNSNDVAVTASMVFTELRKLVSNLSVAEWVY